MRAGKTKKGVEKARERTVCGREAQMESLLCSSSQLTCLLSGSLQQLSQVTVRTLVFSNKARFLGKFVVDIFVTHILWLECFAKV